MIDWTLQPGPTRGPTGSFLLFVVLDGVGVGPSDTANALWLAKTPTLDRLRKEGLYTELKAHGTAVGLPSDADMGNSEVGHNAIGAGRIFDQGAKRVAEAVQTGQIFEGQVWKDLIKTGSLHLIGLLSDGNVHSHESHLHALLRQARAAGLKNVRVHVLLDGRDVDDPSALLYVDRLETLLSELGEGYRIASGGGRMVTTMDRYQADWSMVERGWNAHVHSEARTFPSARAAIETYREESPGLSDQMIPPFVITPKTPMEDGDGVIFFNFRGDRALEITQAFEDDDFSAFDRGQRPDVRYAGMLQYDGDAQRPKHFLVAPPVIDRTLGEYLARNRVSQWACSETQKFGHMTYFWNGNRSEMFDPRYEHHHEIPSLPGPSNEHPEMKAWDITRATIKAIRSGQYRFLRINYANGDMVGHTGQLDAAIRAVETMDECLAELLAVVQEQQGCLLVTADHGNCDEMIVRDKKTGVLTDRPSTRHSLAPVPLYLMGTPGSWSLREGGGLANLAATVTELLGYQAPVGYEPSLLIR